MYEGDGELGRPEKFLQEMIAVPEYSSRIKALIFSNIKEETYYDIQDKVEKLTESFNTLKEDFRLHHILKVALAVGNYLNGTGVKGGAWGFRLDSLENMQEVTSSDNKMNAGFYVIREVWKKHKYPIFDKEDLDRYQYISKMPTTQVKAELGELRLYKNAIEKAFKSKNPKNKADLIDDYCEELLMEVKSKLEALE